MAQGNQNAVMWAESAARSKYAVHDGSPLIGVSGDEGDGFIVPLPAPHFFHQIADEGLRDNVFRALASHALRVGQAKVKAEKTPSRDTATTAVASAIDGSYKPSRETVNDILDYEVSRRFASRIEALVRTKVPDASDKAIADTVVAQADTEAGKTLLAKLRQDVIATGTYAVARKGKSEKGGAVAIDLGA